MFCPFKNHKPQHLIPPQTLYSFQRVQYHIYCIPYLVPLQFVHQLLCCIKWLSIPVTVEYINTTQKKKKKNQSGDIGVWTRGLYHAKRYHCWNLLLNYAYYERGLQFLPPPQCTLSWYRRQSPACWETWWEDVRCTSPGGGGWGKDCSTFFPSALSKPPLP